MKKLIAAALLLAATAAFGKNEASDKHLQRTLLGGGAEYIRGNVGKLPPGQAKQAAKAFLESQKELLGGTRDDSFEAIGEFKDNLGQTHVRLQQRVRGLPVVGAEYIVHSDRSGNVVGMNGRF